MSLEVAIDPVNVCVLFEHVLQGHLVRLLLHLFDHFQLIVLADAPRNRLDEVP